MSLGVEGTTQDLPGGDLLLGREPLQPSSLASRSRTTVGGALAVAVRSMGAF